MINLTNAVDRSGEVIGAIRQSDDVNIFDMTNATNQALAIPDGARFAIFQNLNPSQTLYAKEDTQANAFTAVPIAGNGQELMINPDVRQFNDGTDRYIHMITTGTARIIVSFYN